MLNHIRYSSRYLVNKLSSNNNNKKKIQFIHTLNSIEADLISLQQLTSIYKENPQLQNSVEKVANLIVNAPSVKVTGIGKSGYVGQRMSATFASIGIGSQFIHGTEWYHGDLGSIRENDLIFSILFV